MTGATAPEAANSANSRERTRRLNTLPPDRREEAIRQELKMRVAAVSVPGTMARPGNLIGAGELIAHSVYTDERLRPRTFSPGSSDWRDGG
jgi:hypothetical protein